MSQSIPFRQAAFIIAILAAVQFLIQVSLLMKGIEYVAVSLIVDDTYYYLQTAWNAKWLGFVTFDGLHATNGVQLLWFVIIFLLALLAKTKAALLFTTLAVSFLFNGLCYLIILKIGAALKQPVLALFMASFWALQSLPFESIRWAWKIPYMPWYSGVRYGRAQNFLFGFIIRKNLISGV